MSKGSRLPDLKRTVERKSPQKRCSSSGSKQIRRLSVLPESTRKVKSGPGADAIRFFEEAAEKEQLTQLCNKIAQSHASRYASKLDSKVRALQAREADGDADSQYLATDNAPNGLSISNAEVEVRDFSEIHRLAAIHGAQNAKREISKLLEEAELKKKQLEKEQSRSQSIHGDFKQVQKGHFNQERCRHGSDCSKPSCKNWHPWDSEWSIENNGHTTVMRLNQSRFLYSKIRPLSKYRLRNSTAKLDPATFVSDGILPPNATQELPSLRLHAAEAIDRILSQNGIPDTVRRLAHSTLFPHLLETAGNVTESSRQGFITCQSMLHLVE